MTDTHMLAAISADLDDDTRRLAYADWLDEHDEHDRAELIRVQCRLPGLRQHDHPARLVCGEKRPFSHAMPVCPLCIDVQADEYRERELIDAHPEWTRWPCLNGQWKCTKGYWSKFDGGYDEEWVPCSTCLGTGDLLNYRCITWDRGWPGWVHVERVSELVQTDATPVRYETEPFHATDDIRPTPLLTALATTPPWGVPLRGVIVEGFMPHWNGMWYCWYHPHRSHPTAPTTANLPAPVFDLLTGYESMSQHGHSRLRGWVSQQSAIRAAAAAFLTFGRKHS